MKSCQTHVSLINKILQIQTLLDVGLSCAPKIMTSILQKVLFLANCVFHATYHNIDDIRVQESVFRAEKMCSHPAKYGLSTKDPADLDADRLLGLALKQYPSWHLKMSRGTVFTEIGFEPARLTKRQLSSLPHMTNWLSLVPILMRDSGGNLRSKTLATLGSAASVYI